MTPPPQKAPFFTSRLGIAVSGKDAETVNEAAEKLRQRAHQLNGDEVAIRSTIKLSVPLRSQSLKTAKLLTSRLEIAISGSNVDTVNEAAEKLRREAHRLSGEDVAISSIIKLAAPLKRQ